MYRAARPLKAAKAARGGEKTMRLTLALPSKGRLLAQKSHGIGRFIAE
jgi:hypothetical protein